MSEQKDKLREKIAKYFCAEIDTDYYTPLGRNVGNTFADYVKTLIEPLIEDAKKPLLKEIKDLEGIIESLKAKEGKEEK